MSAFTPTYPDTVVFTQGGAGTARARRPVASVPTLTTEDAPEIARIVRKAFSGESLTEGEEIFLRRGARILNTYAFRRPIREARGAEFKMTEYKAIETFLTQYGWQF